MPRLVIALLVLLTFAPTAHAATRPTVTTAAGTAEAGMVAGTEESLSPTGRVLIADGCIFFGCTAPSLRAEPETTLRRRSTKLLAVLAVPGAAPVTTRLSVR